MDDKVMPTRLDYARGFRFSGRAEESHEPTAAVRMNRIGWPPKAIAQTLKMDISKVRLELAQGPAMERDALA